MADLDKRMRMAAESILENEALRGGLDDEQAATSLLNWGIACAKSLMLETAEIEDDEEADEAVYPRMKALRKMMMAVKELAGSQGQDSSAWQHGIADIFKNAELFYGPNWHAPEQIGDKIWLVLQTGSSLERVQGLQALLEPSGFSDDVENRSYAQPRSAPEPENEEGVSFAMPVNGPEPAPEQTDSEEGISFSAPKQELETIAGKFLKIFQNMRDKNNKGDDDVTFNKKTPI